MSIEYEYTQLQVFVIKKIQVVVQESKDFSNFQFFGNNWFRLSS